MIVSVFNAEPAATSAYLFTNLIRFGFYGKGGSELVLTNGFLGDIFVEPALKYLAANGARILKNTRVSGLRLSGNAVSSLRLKDGDELKADIYLSTVPFFDFKNLLGRRRVSAVLCTMEASQELSHRQYSLQV